MIKYHMQKFEIIEKDGKKSIKFFKYKPFPTAPHSIKIHACSTPEKKGLSILGLKDFSELAKNDPEAVCQKCLNNLQSQKRK